MGDMGRINLALTAWPTMGTISTNPRLWRGQSLGEVRGFQEVAWFTGLYKCWCMQVLLAPNLPS